MSLHPWQSVAQYLARRYPIVLPSRKLARTFKSHSNVLLYDRGFVFHFLGSQESAGARRQERTVRSREAHPVAFGVDRLFHYYTLKNDSLGGFMDGLNFLICESPTATNISVYLYTTFLCCHVAAP